MPQTCLKSTRCIPSKFKPTRRISSCTKSSSVTCAGPTTTSAYHDLNYICAIVIDLSGCDGRSRGDF